MAQTIYHRVSKETLMLIGPALRTELDKINEQIESLTARRAEIEGIIEEPSEATLLAPAGEVLPPKKSHHKKKTSDRRSGMLPELYRILTKNSKPLTSSDITEKWIRQKRLTVRRSEREAIRASISSLLRRYAVPERNKEKGCGQLFVRELTEDNIYYYRPNPDARISNT